MKHHTRVLLAAGLACACLVAATVAWGTQTQTLTVHASFTPDRLGAPTNLSTTAVFGPIGPGPQSPAARVTAY
ncbi:MAG: hypothetical protein WB709_01200, partial [Solirubrobacteraceae bacterium]